MITFTYILNFVLAIAMPLVLGWWLARRFHLAWRLFIVGGVTFVLAEVFYIPTIAGLTLAFRQGILPEPPVQWQLAFNAVVIGLMSAFFEETARYLVLRFVLKDARSWRKALMFGAGHGGAEAIIVGVLAAVTFFGQLSLRSNPETLAALPPEQLELAQAQLAAYWSAPWYLIIMGAVERGLMLCVHMSLAVLVMQIFIRRNFAWWLVAIIWHATVNALAVIGVSLYGPLITEAILALTAVVSIGIIVALRPAEPEPSPAPVSGAAPQLHPSSDPAQEALDSSRYVE